MLACTTQLVSPDKSTQSRTQIKYKPCKMANTENTTAVAPPSWINKDFIQKAVRNGEANPNLTVESIDVRAALVLGENYSSDMFRVTTKLLGASEQLSLIVKIPPRGAYEQMVDDSGIFAKEAHMVSRILPQMHQLLDEIMSGKYQRFSAKCLYHGETPSKFIVFEDLSVHGFKNAPRQRGLDFFHCSLLMQTLARFHAVSVALSDQNPGCMDSYKKGGYADLDMQPMRKYIEGSMISFVEELKKWPEWHARYASKLLNASSTLYDKILKGSNYRPGKFNVLLHGDCWVNNIMFKYNQGKPSELRLVDFQLSAYSSPALDLQYFLHTSCNEEVLGQGFDPLIAEYHSTLTDNLRLLGCSHLGLTLEELKKEIDDYYFFGLYAAISVLPIVIADPGAAREIQKSFGNLVNGEDSSTYSSPMCGNEYFMKCMNRYLPIFEAKGCFCA